MKKINILILFSVLLSFTIYLNGCSNIQSLSKQEKALHNESLTKFAKPVRWQEAINLFKQKDYINPPPKNAVLFVGSSSIVGWDTEKWFQGIVTINRGFGGSYIIDSLYYADSIITSYKPKMIVLYAGDNDAADGKTPKMIFADFKAFAIKIHRELPRTGIIYISIKPSILRWKLWPKMQEANNLIRNFCEKQENMIFVDVSKVMLDSSCQPRKDIFCNDGLHLNEKGYELWTSLVRSVLDN